MSFSQNPTLRRLLLNTLFVASLLTTLFAASLAASLLTALFAASLLTALFAASFLAALFVASTFGLATSSSPPPPRGLYFQPSSPPPPRRLDFQPVPTQEGRRRKEEEEDGNPSPNCLTDLSLLLFLCSLIFCGHLFTWIPRPPSLLLRDRVRMLFPPTLTLL
ncbi:hypothetical protein ZIOFF_043389 [Zingiber officinale]|uniref:Transmembrane protein n=1 Tax=Zingiber officinale TaxID=94328 RepID=A0A8J5KPY8_ZINOF|nr:hypothetical protein ZIOFF_043389 [Zingiber officinale]